jgi:MFS family permease
VAGAVADGVASAPGRRFGVLRRYDFRQLFIGSTISQLGSQISVMALPLVAVLALHASDVEVGALAACTTGAYLLVGLPAGAWVDRMRKRRVLVLGDLSRAVVLAWVPVGWALGVLNIAQLYAVALAAGVVTVFFDTAYQSYLPALVGRDLLVDGNAKLEAVRGISQVGGPTIAGLAIQALTAPIAVAFDAASFVCSAIFVSAIFVGRIRNREARTTPVQRAHLRREVMEGLRFVFGNPLLRPIAMATATYNLFAGMIGLFQSTAAVGAILASLVARRVAARLGQGPTMWLALAAIGPFQLLVPLAQRGLMLWVAASGFLVVWFGGVVYNIIRVSFRQGITPDGLLGRMNATMRFLVWGTTPLGALIGGVLGQVLGPRDALWIAGVGGLLPFLPLFFSPLRTMRLLPTLPTAA